MKIYIYQALCPCRVVSYIRFSMLVYLYHVISISMFHSVSLSKIKLYFFFLVIHNFNLVLKKAEKGTFELDLRI